MHCDSYSTHQKYVFRMNNANEKPANTQILPAQRYYKALPKKVKGDILKALKKAIGKKSNITYYRWLYGHVYPQTIAERNAVAKAMAKYTDCKLTGNELFPEDFPYRGANN